MTELDRYDRRILEELQRDGSLSTDELAERVGLSKTPCWRRVQRLKAEGVIERTVALVRPEAVALDTTVFVSLHIGRHETELLKRIDAALRALPEVMEAYLMTGDADYLVRVAVPDVKSFERFLSEKLHAIEGIQETRSSVALRQVKYTTALPLLPR
jgi:Lrp/AsnC family transcriptional regulator